MCTREVLRTPFCSTKKTTQQTWTQHQNKERKKFKKKKKKQCMKQEPLKSNINLQNYTKLESKYSQMQMQPR